MFSAVPSSCGLLAGGAVALSVDVLAPGSDVLVSMFGVDVLADVVVFPLVALGGAPGVGTEVLVLGAVVFPFVALGAPEAGTEVLVVAVVLLSVVALGGCPVPGTDVLDAVVSVV